MSAVEGPDTFRTVTLLHSSGAHAKISEFGAHVLEWGREPNEQLIFVSQHAVLNGTKAIRGGIPLCWPQFGPGALPQHGFARNSYWTYQEALSSAVAEDGSVTAVFTLESGPRDNFAFTTHLTYSVQLSHASLQVSLKVRHAGAAAEGPLSFTYAAHTYFHADVGEVQIGGLKGCTYEDKVLKGARAVEDRDLVTIGSEVDRKYLNVARSLPVRLSSTRSLTLELSPELPDAVVWNPWITNAKAMADFGDEEYLTMVCVEAGTVGVPVVLEPGAEWTGTLRIV